MVTYSEGIIVTCVDTIQSCQTLLAVSRVYQSTEVHRMIVDTLLLLVSSYGLMCKGFSNQKGRGENISSIVDEDRV